jgi:uncharacterized membrane protein YkoI
MRATTRLFGNVVGIIMICCPMVISAEVFTDEGSYILAEVDINEIRNLRRSGQLVSLESLIVQVRNDYPGEIIEIELDDEDDGYIYEVEIIGEDGSEPELKIDASTGEVLKADVDD